MTDDQEPRVSATLQIDDDVTAAVGRALAAARADAGMSMRELARRAEVSQPFLSQVERGRAIPSILTLYRIAEALGLSPRALMPRTGDVRAGARIVRSAEGVRMAVSESPDAARARLLTAGGDHRLEVVEYDVAPGQDLGDAFRSAGEMTVYVLSGELIVDVEGEATATLAAGDAVSHDAALPHRWRAPRGARVLLAVSHA
ncbi:helix-turn-helix domain-containing protein [Microbacterium sp. NPDC055683]